MFTQSANDLLPPAIVDIFTEFFKSDVDDVVMIKFFWRDFIAEFEPDAVEKVDFFVCQSRGRRGGPK